MFWETRTTPQRNSGLYSIHTAEPSWRPRKTEEGSRKPVAVHLHAGALGPDGDGGDKSSANRQTQVRAKTPRVTCHLHPQLNAPRLLPRSSHTRSSDMSINKTNHIIENKTDSARWMGKEVRFGEEPEMG
jgi:hypothetical protein